MPADYAIETNRLSKTFGDKAAVEDLTLCVERGEVFGFLGPNGSGKTTSVKMLLALVSPTSGEGRLLGARLGNPAARAKVGFLPEHFRFHDWLRADEFLALHADLYGMERQKARRRSAELLDLVGLTPHASKRLKAFSKGMLQRIGLAQALLNEPELIILDEPTSGLDPVGRRLVRDIIHDLRQRGVTVFLNSHFLSEVEITCDRVSFIKHGRVLKTSSLQELSASALRLEIRAQGLSAEIVAGLSRWGGEARLDGETLSLLARQEDIPEINRYLVEKGIQVFALKPQQVSLEDVFIEIVGVDGGL